MDNQFVSLPVDVANQLLEHHEKLVNQYLYQLQEKQRLQRSFGNSSSAASLVEEAIQTLNAALTSEQIIVDALKKALGK